MRTHVFLLSILLLAVQLASSQSYWTLLQAYPSPGNYALGLYYDGKLLWHVDWDSIARIRAGSYVQSLKIALLK